MEHSGTSGGGGTHDFPLLEVTNFALRFRQYRADTPFVRAEFKVIHDFTLCVHEGEILAVIGASGSGKSLLAHAILGILPSNAIPSGSIKYRGEELTVERIRMLRGREIALIPQSVAYLDPLMQVKDQIESPLHPRLRRGEQVLARFQLSPNAGKLFPFQLSGGMARRVLIGTAITSGAKLIIADEPTPGLHESAVEETLRSFRTFADSGCGVIMITHDIDLAFSIADRIAVFCEGRTLAIEETVHFREHPERLKHPYSRALWQALPQNGFHTERGKIYGPDMVDGDIFAAPEMAVPI